MYIKLSTLYSLNTTRLQRQNYSYFTHSWPSSIPRWQKTHTQNSCRTRLYCLIFISMYVQSDTSRNKKFPPLKQQPSRTLSCLITRFRQVTFIRLNWNTTIKHREMIVYAQCCLILSPNNSLTLFHKVRSSIMGTVNRLLLPRLVY